MGLLDIFKINEIKQENEDLKKMLTPEMKEAITIEQKIKELNQERDSLNQQILFREQEINRQNDKLDSLSKEIITFEDEILVQEYGLYQPRYSFLSSDEYKEKLTAIRKEQKQMVKDQVAAAGYTNWTVNNSATKGKKMVKDMQKLLLRAFNSECDETIGKVKYNNFETSKKKILKSAEQIQKLGTMMGICVNDAYIESKIDELHLALEYQIKKKEEKELQRELRAQQREAARLKKEIKEHGENEELLAKKHELENTLSDIDKSIQDIDYREANQRAGYVYVISNIGSFGENIYKIGMTRRLNPQDRVDELGDASVPFNFDVHAMIFSEDAPSLEAALHRAFEDRKLNMVNTRREFFNVTLDEIKEVVKNNFDKTVEFIEFPDADQYRTSLKMKETMQKQA